MAVDYFKHFGLPKMFFLDATTLKRRYYQKSKELHPDFHTLHDETHQEKMLALSAMNNKAYQTLNDFSKRVYYILTLEEMIKEEGENKLPQSFLMEMMEVNEKLMELEFEYNLDHHQAILNEVESLEASELKAVKPLMEAYDQSTRKQEDLIKIREFYFKQKYLWRIRENLDKFAARQ
jgi:molecular chaperone HscB